MKHLAALAILVAFAGCASTAKPQAGAKAPALQVSPVDQLRNNLTAIFANPATDQAQWAVAITSLKQGDTLFRLNAQRLQVPASNQKLLTAAAAIEKLGWDYRYTTRLYASGPINDGTLEGDLIVSGDGDPSINIRHPDRWGAFDAWAAQLHDKGIRFISGRLIGDDKAFAGPGFGLGWAWDDFVYGYGTAVGALQFAENEVEILIGPAMDGAGARAIVSASPPDSGLTINYDVTTGAAGSDTRISFVRDPMSDVLTVRGQIAADAQPTSQTVAVLNPTVMYLNNLRAALARHGIYVAGYPMDIDLVQRPPAREDWALLLEDRSAALSEILDVMLKESRNEYAETLVWTMAAPEKPATAATGMTAVRDALTKLGVPPESYLARDGSGLSRYDYLSPDAVIALLTREWHSPNGERFKNLLPVSGTSGTIDSRMKGTAAEGRVFAKTGSMSQVRALSGYVTTASGEPLAFSIIVNGFRVPARDVTAVMDKALVALAAFSR